MPWTEKQTRYLLSGGSPLTDKQKSKMKSELHDEPALGHAPAVNALALNPKPKKRINDRRR